MSQMSSSSRLAVVPEVSPQHHSQLSTLALCPMIPIQLVSSGSCRNAPPTPSLSLRAVDIIQSTVFMRLNSPATKLLQSIPELQPGHLHYPHRGPNPHFTYALLDPDKFSFLNSQQKLEKTFPRNETFHQTHTHTHGQADSRGLPTRRAPLPLRTRNWLTAARWRRCGSRPECPPRGPSSAIWSEFPANHMGNGIRGIQGMWNTGTHGKDVRWPSGVHAVSDLELWQEVQGRTVCENEADRWRCP